jgi:hypothetical protein
MSVFKRLPMDIVKHILLYDSRFVLRNGEIIQINKLDMNKYKTAVLNLLLLTKKSRVTSGFWNKPLMFWCDIRFSNGHRMFYGNDNIFYIHMKLYQNT